MKPLANKEIKSHEKQKVCHICKKGFQDDDKNKKKVRDHCHYTQDIRGAAHSKCNLRYSVPKKFQQYLIMDQHMIIIL